MWRLAVGVILLTVIVSVGEGLADRWLGGRSPGAAPAVAGAAASSFFDQQLSPVAGDVDCGGSVDVVDALLILRTTAGLLVNAACMAPSGDVNCSGSMDAVDASFVLRFVAGLAAQSPPGCPLVGVRAVELAVSAAANGTHLVPGEQVVVTITLNDQLGGGLTRDDIATLNLYMYGPQEPPKTKTAVKLLNAETDRSKRPHHYIDLLTNPDVKVNGNKVTYTLKPVSDEEPGTYVVTVWAVSKISGLFQQFPWVELQIGTATLEKQLVDGSKCQACHRGTDSGKFYMHHIDPGRSPTGNWAIDSDPVRTCNSCHNTDGYAAYSGNIDDPTSEDPNARTSDPTVRRAHGVHNGAHLENVFNIDPEKGDFGDYIHVEFPADARNCTSCHVDNRYKELPSRMACGACHDNVWFGEAADMPEGREPHSGGPQADDLACSSCHPADSGGAKAVAEAHKVEPYAFKHTIGLSMSAPANGKFYVAGEAPTVTFTVRDAASGAVINPNTMAEPADPKNVQPNEWRRAYLFVSGPRENTQPVLTKMATEVGPAAHYYASNDFRVLNDAAKMDPRFTRTATSITYQLDDVAGLEPGTYSAWVETMPSAPIGGWALLNFQVGTATPEKKVATNCTQCHGNTAMHKGYFAVEYNPDICNSCHDYKRQIEGKSGWTSSNNGYGAAPLSRRVHGVHFGRYLDKPGEVHQQHDYSKVIFPLDVRNCTKCHSSETSGTWKTAPSRVACLSCHDSDAAIGHAALNTVDGTPAEPYSGDEVETCNVCHGAGKGLAPDKVHNVAKPYKPPYPREPAE